MAGPFGCLCVPLRGALFVVVQVFQKIEQKFDAVLAKTVFQSGSNGAAFFGIGFDQPHAFWRQDDNGFTSVFGVAGAGHEAFFFHRGQNAGEAGQKQAGSVGDRGLFHRAAFGQNPEHTPFLLRNASLGQHVAERSHHGLSCAQQGDGEGS